MAGRSRKVFLISICIAAVLTAQQPSGLALAQAMDNESRALRHLPDEARSGAIKTLASRIRQQPARYAVPLAFNLAVDGVEGSNLEVLQLITTPLGDSLRKLALSDSKHGDSFEELAKLLRYEHTSYRSQDPRLTAAIAKLQSNDRARAAAGFTLRDLSGKQWGLKSLRGKIVLINFWATWCPPCQREIPDLNAIYERFQNQGLVILAISDEEPSTQRHFLEKNTVSYPMLIDTGSKTRERFLIEGTPMVFIYDRTGALVSQSEDRPSMEGFLRRLKDVGLR